MQRVIAYVDGFNLYFGLKQSGFRRYYWLDLAMLARHLLKPNQQLVATHYFTARIRDNGRNAADQKTRKVVRQPQATPVGKKVDMESRAVMPGRMAGGGGRSRSVGNRQGVYLQDWAVTSLNLDMEALLARATPPA